jgi:hypothetical protein
MKPGTGVAICINGTRNFQGGVLLTLALAACGNVPAQAGQFEPGKLAVLRVGDGGSGPGGPSDFESRQNPVFVDQYDCQALHQDHPTFSVALPTNGPDAIWINGNASTEGGMERSADHRIITVPGYCGDILSRPGTPARLAYDRGICVVDAAGSARLACKGSKWYGLSGDKTNPRDAVSDGANNFWGAGSAMGTLFCNGGAGVLRFKSVSSTRAIKIINNNLYASIMASDGRQDDKDSLPGGVYNFTDSSGALLALPKTAGAVMTPLIRANEPYTHVAGFDINPQGSIAYLADVVYGIQKYVKTGGEWQLAYSFYIPGYDGPQSGILTNTTSTEVRTGCFGLAVDFSGPHPILYATTTDAIGYHGKSPNLNRLIRIEDTSTVASGGTITNFARTLATAGGTNVSFRAVAFTPERKP